MADHDDPLARAFGPQTHQSREQRVHGLVTARVERIEDDGTYRLKVHGMNGQDDDDESAPARVMMPMAGGKRGFHFFPEKGDEVVVAFHVGDTNNPIILGAVWNKDDKPPDQAEQSADNNIRTIVSRSGHELTFDDTAGSEKVTLKSQAGHRAVLDDSPTGPKITLQTNEGRTVVLDDTPPGKITVETPTCQLTLNDASGSVTISATATLNLKASVIVLDANTVMLGSTPGSTMIEGVPFRVHTHTGGTILGLTGPVST